MDLYKAYVGQIRQQKIIWHVCTPKSASTFFMRNLQAAAAGSPHVSQMNCVPFHKNRPQVVCAYTVMLSISPQSMGKVLLSPHVHAVASQDLLEMISENHLVIVQTRSLMDTIVSLRDQLDRTQWTPFGVVNHLDWPHLTKDEKTERLITTYLPWHVQFHLGWEAAAAEKNVKWVNYSEVIADPARFTREVFDFHGVPVRTSEIAPTGAGNVNFNVGRAGRGNELLSPTQKARIHQVVGSLTRVRDSAHLQLQ